jgi:alkylresorcinol/alkylpyrone synthase
MFITGVGAVAPRNRYAQRECWEALCQTPLFDTLSTRSRGIVQRVLCGDNGISTRHFALENLDEVFEISPGVLHARFARHAPALAMEAARQALGDARCEAREIDALLISTCTGYLCPGLTSYVSEGLGLRSDALLLDLVGQGCGAALPNLRAAEAILAAGRAAKVLSVCVEICSAAFYLDNDPGVLISASLFGDGAGAAVLEHRPIPGQRRVKWRMGATQLVPGARDQLRFEHRDGMLRNVLSLQVPRLAAGEVAGLLASSLGSAGVARADLTGWILHAGGRDVLVSLRDRLGLSEAEVRHSARVLREFGNLSSATLFFVLRAALKDTVPDGLWWMSTFGAGFSCHGSLLEVG